MTHYPVEKEAENPFAYNPAIVPVPVIAAFDSAGNITPLYLRYEGLKLKIDHVKWSSNRMEYIYKYCCEITLQDRVQEVILYYHRKMDRWTMERMKE